MQTALLNIEDFKDLYAAVQRSGIFADSKVFTDAIPKFSVASIVDDFENAEAKPDFDLRDFVDEHFELPQADHKTSHHAQHDIVKHIELLWDELSRKPDTASGTLIPLPHPYIVPGGRFREIYYWDSFFTMLGLRESGRIDLIEAMVDNFNFLIHEFGFIPNGNRTYYLSRSQPPFFSLMVDLLAKEKGDEIYVKYLPALHNEYDFWMHANDASHVIALPDAVKLNRYYDAKDTPRPEAFVEDEHTAAGDANVYRHLRSAAESGWDFSSRWLRDWQKLSTIHTCDILPVDLNCLLYFLEKTIARAEALAGNTNGHKTFEQSATTRKAKITELFWNDEKQSFYDFDHTSGRHIIHENLAIAFPLYFKIASQEQARAVADKIELQFLKPGGLVTTLYKTGQQWDAPNGWAPLQYMAVAGLQHYGYGALANRIKRNWMQLCERVFENTGKMMEKYNVEDISLSAGGGEYPNQDGFGWTNGVYLAFLAMK